MVGVDLKVIWEMPDRQRPPAIAQPSLLDWMETMAHYRVRKLFALPLVAALSFNAVALGPAQAALVPTTDVIRDGAVSSADRDRVNTFMEREEVRREIEKLGVDSDEAALRVSALSDEEIASITERLDQLPAGEGAVGAVVGAALIVFIVLLITDIACLTSVFPFTRCATK